MQQCLAGQLELEGLLISEVFRYALKTKQNKNRDREHNSQGRTAWADLLAAFEPKRSLMVSSGTPTLLLVFFVLLNLVILSR